MPKFRLFLAEMAVFSNKGPLYRSRTLDVVAIMMQLRLHWSLAIGHIFHSGDVVMRRGAMRKPWLFLTPLALAGGFALTSIPAHATFVIDTSCTDSGCTGSVDFKNDSAVKGVTSFTGTVGGHAGSAVTVDTTGAIDTGAGFSTIKPVKGGTLTDLLFTPADDTLFSDFSFRGQLNPVDDTGIISVKWTDSAGTSGTIMFTGVAGPDTDFARLGIDSTDGETLKSVEVSTAGGESFNEFKQVQFSGAGITPIPEPSTYVLMLLGFAGLGYAGLHKAKSGRRDVAIA